jgi:hypothetical protein
MLGFLPIDLPFNVDVEALTNLHRYSMNIHIDLKNRYGLLAININFTRNKDHQQCSETCH